jgi:hypothetical protein
MRAIDFFRAKLPLAFLSAYPFRARGKKRAKFKNKYGGYQQKGCFSQVG